MLHQYHHPHHHAHFLQARVSKPRWTTKTPEGPARTDNALLLEQCSRCQLSLYLFSYSHHCANSLPTLNPFRADSFPVFLYHRANLPASRLPRSI
ncbi:hypothetical protein K443DRAFT_397210 [Laccaria amethystina LaAM-08-1]|uniref:Uncharacterized protein n=1 Tax=Laccaria amethystina LaAM-08-1 TaxID=1095629 RepID=A0A0C9X7A6_9AGAR|nr:hypothetical protein K443DRAFT_397210 [Laccaria amethystina LaAM-08-1]